MHKVGHLAQDPPPLTTALLLFPLGYFGSNFMSDIGLFKKINKIKNKKKPANHCRSEKLRFKSRLHALL